MTDSPFLVLNPTWFSMEKQNCNVLMGSHHVSIPDSPKDGYSDRERLDFDLDFDLDFTLNWALESLQNGDFQQRWEVMKVLPKLGDKAIAPLIKILQDEDLSIEQRWFAGRILGKIEDPQGIAALVECLQTTEEEELAEVAVKGLSALGPSAIAQLTQLLASPETRLLATRTLSQIHSSKIVDPLLSVVTDENPEIRQLALEALSNFGDPRILPVLITALEDPYTPVRKEAVIGLGLWGKSTDAVDFVGLLKPRLYDFKLEVCQQAAIALGRLKTTQATTSLCEVLQSPHTPIPLQLDIIRALGWMETPESLQALKEAFPWVSMEGVLEILRVFGQINSPHLKSQVSQILLHCYQTQPSRFTSIPVKQRLTQTWGHLGDPCAIHFLQELSQDTDPKVRLHAIAALQKF